MAWESFPGIEFDLCFKVKWGCHTKMLLFLPHFWCYGFIIRQTMKSKGHGREIIKHLPYLRLFVCLSVCLFTKFAGNV